MCGRYTLTTTANFKKRFGILGEVPKFDKSYNISPSTYNPVIVRNSPNSILLMKWGYVPTWSKDKKFSLINIRRETMYEKTYFKNSLKNFRCLIPADGFYEWKRIKLEDRDEKIPYFFHLEKRKVFSFAGLYSKLSDAEGKPIYTYAIITCPPNSSMQKIHNRMPVILRNEDEDKWLNRKNFDFNNLIDLLIPYDDRLKLYPVGRGVNNPINDTASLIERIDVKK